MSFMGISFTKPTIYDSAGSSGKQPYRDFVIFRKKSCMKRLKKRWGVDSNWQAIVILVVFSLTGMSTLWVRKAVWPLLGLTADTPLWIKAPLYVLIIFPTYQVLQLIIAFIFGQFQFFWNFEKKMFRRLGLIRPKKFPVVAAAFLFTTNSVIAMNTNYEKATLGGGCFWCTEAIYKNLNGVTDVVPGYSGGFVKNPAYREVCNGTTGHAEVVQITFDPSVISFAEILEVFFATHDPTTLNRQGADVGTQYRSAIFYHSDAQKKVAEEVISRLTRQKTFDNPIVTEVTPFSAFYPAEDYHKDYFARNPNQPYCRFVVAPKLDKFEKRFKDKIKK